MGNLDETVNREPTAEDVLAEAQRRLVERRATPEEQATGAPVPPLVRALVIGADRSIFWLTRHWLAVFNVIALLYVGLPFLAPVLMRAGHPGSAHVIYTIYRPLCHQLPYRSWYLFGEQLSYTQAELLSRVGADGVAAHGYLGDPQLGYKVALCQRDVAIYGAIFLAGIAFIFIRRRLKPLPLWAYLAFGVAPVGLDGGVQFVSYLAPYVLPFLEIPPLESNPVRRTITGALFGLATVWLAYPNVESAFSEVAETLEQRFGWQR